jgi:enterochelin esterase-like enzyme
MFILVLASILCAQPDSLLESSAPAALQTVPKGELRKFSHTSARIFPGTVRDYWVYIPAQYDGKTPACLYVNQDGVQWNAPEVFDKLIAGKEMPVTIGVFVTPGRVPSPDSATALDRFNRSLEYDGLGDRYARYLAEELLPDVEKRAASDGRPIKLSRNPDDRAIGGASSGAVCAFTAAWERPDLFRRVFSAIGTYVGLRGADRYPTLIRKTEPKPLRIFLQDGSADLNIYGGDWWVANQMMERALTFAGYEVNHSWDDGEHNGVQGTRIFPDAMRWLWKDWPKPISCGTGANSMLREIVVPGEGWQTPFPAGKGWGLAADPTGTLHLFGGNDGMAYRLSPDGKATPGGTASAPGSVQAIGPDGAHYRYESGKGLFVEMLGRKPRKLANIGGLVSLLVTGKGALWAVQTENGDASSTLWHIAPDGRKTRVERFPFRAGGITFSPDQTLLYVSSPDSHWVWSYQIAADGSLQHGQQYCWLHTPDDSAHSGAGAMCVDRDGRLYVATRMGVQVCDQAGRVNCILPLPGSSPALALCFAGEGSKTLFVQSDSRLFARKLAITGRNAWEQPNKPAPPRL